MLIENLVEKLVAVTLCLLLLPAAAAAQNCLDAEDDDPLCAVFVDAEGNVRIDPDSATALPVALLDVRGGQFVEGGSGDVTGDGDLNITDVIKMISYVNGDFTFDEAGYATADYNGDGRVSPDDLAVLYAALFHPYSKLEAMQAMERKYGMYDVDVFYVNADVGIGTTTPQGALDVDGAIYQRGGVLHADYVFEPDYELESIAEHAEYMWREKHLPAVPKARKDGQGREVVEVGSQRRGLLEELEKAHIYIAQLHERLEAQEAELAEVAGLARRTERLEAALAELTGAQP